jgi:poly(3-hydroxybutyrate) depolymerase
LIGIKAQMRAAREVCAEVHERATGGPKTATPACGATRMRASQPDRPRWALAARPYSYLGADQPARRSFAIHALEPHEGGVAVRAQDVLELPYGAVKQFARVDRTGLPKILVVAPLSGHFPILLRDLVLGLVPRFQVFVTDWVNARHVPTQAGPFGLAENIDYVARAMRTVGRGLHVIAPCQAAIPALAAAALASEDGEPATPRSLILMAGPVDPAANATRVYRLLRSHGLGWYERNVLLRVSAPDPAAGRRVYPASVQLAGLMAYLARHLVQGGELAGKLLHDDGADPLHFPFLELYTSLMDLTSEVFLDIVHHIYQERSLPTRRLCVGPRPVELAAIRATALMTIEGEEDDIAAPGQTRSAQDLCVSIPNHARRELVIEACGHFSLFHGHIWRERVLPEVAAFIEAHERASGTSGRDCERT